MGFNLIFLTLISCSRISQLKIPGLSFLYSSIFFSTSGVATRGLEPPMTPGRMEPVSWYRLRILETQPWLTRSWREMTQGRTPAAAISMIFNRTWLGKGRPLMKTPPSWLTRPWPLKKKWNQNLVLKWFHLWFHIFSEFSPMCPPLPPIHLINIHQELDHKVLLWLFSWNSMVIYWIISDGTHTQNPIFGSYSELGTRTRLFFIFCQSCSVRTPLWVFKNHQI